MKTYRGFSKVTLRSLLGGILGAALLLVHAAYAQATVSTSTIQVSGSASAQKTGLGETVNFSGPLVVTSKVVTGKTRKFAAAATAPVRSTDATPCQELP